MAPESNPGGGTAAHYRVVPRGVGADGLVSLVDQPLAGKAIVRAAPRWLPLAGALAVCAAVLVALRPELAGWIVFTALALVAGVLEPMVPLLLLPCAVAFGSLVSLSARGINIGPTDVLVAVLVLGVIVRVPISRRSKEHRIPGAPGWVLSALKGRST